MKMSVALVPAILAIIGGAVWGLMVANSKPGRWSRFPNQLEIRERKERERLEREGVPAEKAAALAAASNQEKLPGPIIDAQPAKTTAAHSAPKVAIDEPLFNFGTMNPFSKKRHQFAIRNDGTDTLTLKAGPTTCKCTACDVLSPSIAPGAVGFVELEWKTVGRKEHYRHGATVYTNDAVNSEVRLVIEGAVRTHLGAEPSDFILPRVNPLESTEAQTVIYSQSWESFEIQNISSTMEDLTWEISPATPEELKAQGARSGHALKVVLPADLPSGEFKETLRFEIVNGESPEDKPLEYEIGLQGKVLRRLAIHGQAIDSFGTIRLEPVDPKVGRKTRSLMKVHDSQLDLPINKIECQPEFVEVKITPYKPGGKQVGLYYLDVIVPPGIPPTARMVDNPGTIKIDFEHPRVEDLNLKLQFVVASPE